MFEAFGLNVQGSAVLLRTDQEDAVGTLIGGANFGVRVVPQQAPPQGHETVGGAERTVRKATRTIVNLTVGLEKHGS